MKRSNAWVALVLCACAGGPAYPDEPTAVVDVPSPADSSEPVASRDAGPDATLEVGLPAPFDVLGKSCPENERDRPHLFCDTRGKVSGVTAEATPATEALPLPGARTVHKNTDFGPPPGRSLEVGVAGQLIAVNFVVCPRCESPKGFTFVGDLSRMTDADLAVLQQRIGLPPGTLPLRTHDDWQRALRADAG